MPAGFQVLNTANTVQIDDTYKNHVLIGQGSFSSGPYIDAQYWSITLYGDGQMVAVTNALGQYGSPIALRAVRDLNNGYYSYDFVYRTGGNVESFDYFIFGKMPDNYSGMDHGAGLQVFDPAGKLTYDSNFKYMRIVDIARYTTGRNTYTPGRREALILMTPCLCQRGYYGGYEQYSIGGTVVALPGNFWDGAISLSDVTINSVDTSEQGANTDLQPSYDYDALGMIVDVTGF